MVTPDGSLAFDASAYASPSPAAQAIVGGNRNGWSFWQAHLDGEGPVLLDELRAGYRASGQ